MIVREIMALLAQENPEAPVLVDGHESGFDVPHLEKCMVVRPARPEERKSWEGRYARHLEMEGLAFEAIVIRRPELRAGL